MTDAELYDIKTLCSICGSKRRFKHLGSHIGQKHKTLANEYKKQLGININVSLVDDTVSQKLRDSAHEHIDEIKKVFNTKGAAYRIKKGQTIKDRYISTQRFEQLSHLNEKRQKGSIVCRLCGKTVELSMKWRKWCLDCMPKIVNERQRVGGYSKKYFTQHAKDPNFIKQRSETHAKWAKKNKKHLAEYRKLRRLIPSPTPKPDHSPTAKPQ